MISPHWDKKVKRQSKRQRQRDRGRDLSEEALNLLVGVRTRQSCNKNFGVFAVWVAGPGVTDFHSLAVDLDAVQSVDGIGGALVRFIFDKAIGETLCGVLSIDDFDMQNISIGREELLHGAMRGGERGGGGGGYMEIVFVKVLWEIVDDQIGLSLTLTLTFRHPQKVPHTPQRVCDIFWWGFVWRCIRSPP
jgi:hypothetical protein